MFALIVLGAIKVVYEGFKEHIAAPYVEANDKKRSAEVAEAKEEAKVANRHRDIARANNSVCETALGVVGNCTR